MKNLRYNGNISSMQWQNGASAAKSGYKFSYDGLNRLTSAIYGEGDDMSQNADRFSEKNITYNANGSIYRMMRYGMLNDGSYGLVDDLRIKLDGNALYGITDYAAETNYKGSANFVDADGSGQEYWFNGNGSLAADANKGIARIDYDNYGCPRKIVFTNGNTTEYVYSSTGEKLRTTHKTAIDGITVALNGNDNLKDDDFLSEDKTDYHGSFIYENGKLDKVLFQGGYVQNDSICAGSLGKPRGFAHTDNTSLNILEQVYVYHYYTQDHLGNNRAVIDEGGNVKQVTNYYPFGGVFSTTAYNHGDDLQPYKYNGKELDRTHGLDWYDYGARNYDAFLPMFTSLDPHCEKYYNVSPYVYCLNNPMKLVDRDGKEPGEFFTSPENAAKDFGMLFNGNSIKVNKEYGSTIFVVYNEKNEMGYTYSVPAVGDDISVQPSKAPSGAIVVANVHSHGAYTYHSNEFSGNRDDKGEILTDDKRKDLVDETDIGGYNKEGVVGFLTTPNGSLQKYDPKTGKIEVLDKNLPSDTSMKMPNDDSAMPSERRLNTIAPTLTEIQE